MMSESNLHRVGVFDSGVGGLSVLREMRKLLPAVPLLYVADQAHIPYGERPLEEILHYSREITRFLLAHGAGLIVVACNTASAAALDILRQDYPDVPFVGMEPAVKPASQQTRSHVVGVLATPATFQGRLYATLVERFAHDVTILTSTLPGLVEAIERGELDTAATRAILSEAIQPMLAEGADTLVLGCTHFPFVLPLIRQIAGGDVNVIDPAPAIARRAATLIRECQWTHSDASEAEMTFATSGDSTQFAGMLQHLLGISAQPLQLAWHADSQQLSEMRISVWH